MSRFTSVTNPRYRVACRAGAPENGRGGRRLSAASTACRATISWAAQNRRPALPDRAIPNYAQNAAYNRYMSPAAESVAPQRETADQPPSPFDNSSGKTVANWEPDDEPDSPPPDDGFPSPGGRYQPNSASGGPSDGNECDQCGGTVGCCRCCPCGPPGRFWVRDEYLAFWTKGDSLPVLVTTSPTGTLPASEVLFGGNTVNGGFRSAIGYRPACGWIAAATGEYKAITSFWAERPPTFKLRTARR